MTNEEKYKTPQGRTSAFTRFCSERNCRECQCRGGGANCRFAWLALEAEEEKPIPCPFCGGDNIDIFETDFGRSEDPYQFAVKCHSCGALVSAEDKGEAIAAWNRRVK